MANVAKDLLSTVIWKCI